MECVMDLKMFAAHTELIFSGKWFSFRPFNSHTQWVPRADAVRKVNQSFIYFVFLRIQINCKW